MEVLHESQDLQALDFKQVDCLPAVKREVAQSPNFGGCGFQEDGGVKSENREIWIGQGGDVSNGGDVDGGPSLFYAADDFPSLPEFPCMSSSSSTSSTPAPSTAPAAAGFSSSVCSTSSSSSSSAASWAMLKSDAEAEDDHHRHHHHHTNQQQPQLDQEEAYDDRIDGVDCMNVMEDFDCMGINQLIEDSNEIWDPSPLFESDPPPQIPQTHQLNPFDQFQQQGHHLGDLSQSHQEDHSFLFLDPSAAGGGGHSSTEAENPESASALSEDLAVVFFEWLKSNKESISAEELRSIKIKKSTIESAARRLGGGKEGMKQLLKLILQWVQNHRLQNNRRSQGESAFDLTQPLQITPPLPPPHLIQQEPLLPCYNPLPPHHQQPSQWISPYVTDPGGVAIAPAPPSSSFTSYIGGGHDPYGVLHQPYHVPPPPPLPDQYHMLDGNMAPWTGQLAAAQPQYPPGPMHYNTGPDGSVLMHSMAPQGYPGYGNGYSPYQMFPGGPGDGLVRTGSSATKEARKKRMARQRRGFTHHHHRNSHSNPNQQHHGNGGQQQMVQGGGCGDHDSSGSVAHGGWMYWPPTTAGQPMMGSIQPHQQQPAVLERAAVMAQGSQRQAASSDKKQGFKTEKNLKFLLQKVLKQSDVGNLGRIVLPKKEAETHLPELEARDGIPIAMEDIGTSRVWNMRYRFWPNNKSRMYLLENTGDFVRSNGLQEGDFIVIYSDVKCGKYMIRGVKVRPQQQGSKPELAKKPPPSKVQKTQSLSSPASSALSPITHMQ